MMRQIRRAAGLTIGAMIYSAGLNLFLVPNNIIDGGVTGMSLLLSELAGIPFSVLIVLLNIPFFILGYKQLGLRLAVSSMFAIIVLSFWSHIFEQMEPVTTDPFLSTIFGGIIIGLGIGLVIKTGIPRRDRNCCYLSGQPFRFFRRRNYFILQFLHFGKRRFCFYMEQRHVFPYCLLYLFPHDGCRFHGA